MAEYRTAAFEPSTMTVSVGPQHPGSGHFRIILTLDGDIIVKVVPEPGYVHRGDEKMAEYRTYITNVPHLERPVIHDSSGILYAYALAAEELIGLKPPERGQYIRMIMAELNRIISHLYWLGIYGIFLGHSTMFMWPMGDREFFIDLAEMIGGTRVTFSLTIPGGVRNDMPEPFKDKALKYMAYFEKRLEEYRKIWFENPLFLKRTERVGVLNAADAVDLGCVGPTLRASNTKSDTRRDEPYDAYDKIDFEIPVYKDCDSRARAMVHYDEMKQSMNIIRQCLKQIPSGPVKNVPKGVIKGAPGEVFARSEAARGQVSYFIVSDGGTKPYRVKISTPSYRNLIALNRVLVGMRVADLPAAYWSLDYWPVEADR